MSVKVKASKAGKSVFGSSDDIQFDADKNYAMVSGPYQEIANIDTPTIPGAIYCYKTITHNRGFIPNIFVILDFTKAITNYGLGDEWFSVSHLGYIMIPTWIYLEGYFELRVTDTDFTIFSHASPYRNVGINYYIVENL